MTALNARWKQRPPGSNWGDFGPDDQLGRINLLTAEKVRQGVAEVIEGRAFCLSLPLDYPGGSVLNPRRRPPSLHPTEMEGVPFMNKPLSFADPRNTDIVCDDQVLLTLQYSTQWDSLAHVGYWFDADCDGVPEKVFYNGFKAHEDILGPEDMRLGSCACGTENRSYATALGIENMAVHTVQGRGVLIDLQAHLGNRRNVVGYHQLMDIIRADGVIVEPGDILALHTGFSALLLDMNREPDMAVLNEACAVLDGRDEQLLQWITDSGVAAICADNYAVEAHPAREAQGRRPALPLHAHCLFKLGLPLGELWWLSDLAAWLRANRRHRFLLTAPPLRLSGAVGSPLTPVATV